MRKQKQFVAAMIACASVGFTGASLRANIALTPTETTGGQNYDSLFGEDFDANQPIKITQLGVLDNGADNSLKTDSPTQPIVIQLWNRDTGVALAEADFGANSVGGNGSHVVFSNGSAIFVKDLTPSLVLPAGRYYISEDYSSAELFENDGNHPTIDDGGGLITFVGSGRASSGHDYMYPIGGGGFIDGGPANQYAGPDFTFTAVPEPASLAVFALAAGGLLARRRSRHG